MAISPVQSLWKAKSAEAKSRALWAPPCLLWVSVAKAHFVWAPCRLLQSMWVNDYIDFAKSKECSFAPPQLISWYFYNSLYCFLLFLLWQFHALIVFWLHLPTTPTPFQSHPNCILVVLFLSPPSPVCAAQMPLDTQPSNREWSAYPWPHKENLLPSTKMLFT